MKTLATLPLLTSLIFRSCETLPLGTLMADFIAAQVAAQHQQQQKKKGATQEDTQPQQQQSEQQSNISSSSACSEALIPPAAAAAVAVVAEKRCNVVGLRQLVLSGNTQLRVCGSVLGQLTGLQVLDLSGCRAVGGKGLEGLTGLRKINLAGELMV